MRYNVNEFGNVIDSFDGHSGKDAHGEYVIAPIDHAPFLSPGSFLQDADGKARMTTELSYAELDGARFLKIYIK